MALPRIHHAEPLDIGNELELPSHASRHIQVLRMQPGQQVSLFPGDAPELQREYIATITAMGRQSVSVRIESCSRHTRENRMDVHLAIGMPTNERMDWLVEKATELGVASITPLMTERSVLRLKGERADKKREHWQAIAVAACEQSGRNRVPRIHAPQSLQAYLTSLALPPGPANPRRSEVDCRLLLGFEPSAEPLATRLAASAASCTTLPVVTVLSGPEGGLSPAEEQTAQQQGFAPTTLGTRVLRADTAPLAVCAYVALLPQANA